MRKIRIIIFFVLGCCVTISAQEVKPIKITIEQGIPGESFSKTNLGIELWVQEKEDLVYIDQTKSKVMELKADSDENLLYAHQKAIANYKKYVADQEKVGRYIFSSRTEQLIDFYASTSFRDTLGFKFVLNSWAIPLKNTSNIHCKALISYFIVDVNYKCNPVSLKM